MIFNLIIGFMIISKYADIALVSSLPTVQRSPEELANKFEGDIAVSAGTARGVGVRSAGARWPNNTVPYVISSVYTVAEKTIIENAMRKIEQLTAINNFVCVQFRPKLANDLYYISIISDVGCYSYVGFNGWTAGQNVSFQKTGCMYEGTIMHELLHVLGFWHEQSRPDRDSYVRVNWTNIAQANQKDFQKKTTAEADTLNTPYDYASIMHYGRYYFSSNGYPTIEPLQPNVQIGDRTTLSAIDTQEIQTYYSCSAKGATLLPITTTTTTSTAPPSLLTSGRWSTTGSLAIGRAQHTSTVLSDNRVITIGGNADGAGVELYNLATRTWSSGAPMINARSAHSATLLPDGRLFVAGGWYYNTCMKTAEIYNPASNTWTAVSNMNLCRYGHAAVYLPAPVNKILVMGGFGGGQNFFSDSQTCELYDFATNKWTLTTSMTDKRVYLSAFYLPSLGKVVAIGGGVTGQWAELYTVSTAQWTRSVNTMPGMYSPTFTLLPNGQVLIACGYAETNTYLFNPTTNSFTSAATITQGRQGASSVLLPSGLVLITGGLASANSISSAAEVYDYRTNTWRSVANLNTARFRHTSVVLSGSSQLPVVLVIAGQIQGGVGTSNCEQAYVQT